MFTLCETLQQLTECWNNHNPSSEHCLTPKQLFIRGAIQLNMLPSIPQMLRSGNPHDNADLQEVDVEEVAVPRMLVQVVGTPLASDHANCV